MKKVLIITYYWPPSGGSGVQRWLKFARYLPEYGFEPVVLTVKPDKASYPVLDPSLEAEIPEGLKVFKTNTLEVSALYRKLIGKGSYPHSSFDNERKPSAGQKISRFIRGNFFIPDSRMGWKRFALRKAKKLIREYGISYVVTTGPPHSVHLTGLALKKCMNVNWIADFRDPWTDIFYYDAFYHTPWAERIDRKLEQKVVEECHRLSIVSPALKDIMKAKSDKICPDKILVIPNGFDEEDFRIPSRPPKDQFLATFTGSLSNDNRKMDAFGKALKKAVRLHAGIPVKFRFVGNIDESIRKVFKENDLENILETIPYVPHRQAVKYLRESTLCFSTIRRSDKNKGIISGKIFDYLGSEKPVFCIGPTDGNVADILEECEAGKVMDYEDLEGMIAYLSELMARWKSNPNLDHRNPTYKKYSRRALTRELTRQMKELS
ncbi:MAG: glycosyltransferase family 4 protein [Bacteroidales bacterium]